MPPRPAPLPQQETQSPAVEDASDQTVSGALGALEKLLESHGVTDSQVIRRASNGDLGGLNDGQKSVVAQWYAEQCGLHPSDVAVIALQGRCVPYVKAAGVMRFARDRYKSLDHETPIIQSHGSRAFVTVFASVEMSDGRKVRDFASRPLTDHNSIMACSTAATVRVLRIAVGIPIPSEGEI